MSPRIALLAAAALLGGVSSAQAQFANMDINALNNSFNARMNSQMGTMQNNMVASNMQNPQVIAAWRANPRGMNLQQYAYMYGATGGFTPQGMRYWNDNEANNAAKEQAAMAAYRQAQAGTAAAFAERNAHAQYNNGQAGLGLTGQQTYYGPQGPVNLSYMPGATAQTQGGYTYRPDGRGNWIATGPGGSFYVPSR